LNAKCVLLSSFLGSSKTRFGFEGYQIKILSILFSAFEDVLFLDADNFPVYDPKPLFSSRPYQEKGMVLWKDFWKPTFSPLFLSISNIDEKELGDKQTIEAGQILINKKRKARTLMMAAYYNIFGEWFYDLISQGGPGQGDKDTFVPAALVVDESFYTVDKVPDHLGTRGNGAAVLQFDAAGDWGCSETARSDLNEAVKSEVSGGGKEEVNDVEYVKVGGSKEKRGCEVPPLFIHASWPPKLNALHNVRNDRQWGTEEHAISLFGVDIEKVAWGYMVEMACEGDNSTRVGENPNSNSGVEEIGGSGGSDEKIEAREQRRKRDEGNAGLGLGKIEFWDWGEGDKSKTVVCEQTRNCFRNMFGVEYVFGGVELDV
jgi:alpha 1,2-mannosyltransferase